MKLKFNTEKVMSIFEGGFEEPKERFPDKIFTEVTKDFSTATEGLAELGLIELSGVERLVTSALLNKRFRYKAILRSTYLPEYSFEVLEFGYDISLFPVSIDIEDGIRQELGVEEGIDNDFQSDYLVECGTEALFEQSLKDIFATKKFKKTVGGLMKIARSKQGNAVNF